MFKEKYSQSELNTLLAKNPKRKGWDFSVMQVEREPVPWYYLEVVKKYLRPQSRVLDIGTGGGERFLQLASHFNAGVGIDIDTDMIATANKNKAEIINITFHADSADLTKTTGLFDVILNRHAPFDLAAVRAHLKDGGYFITQQVGINNMGNIKKILGQETPTPDISRAMLEQAGFKVLEFLEYDVKYVVKDIESLIFWLQALDYLHSDLKGADGLKDVAKLNEILEGNVTTDGFVTNEHRYLAVAKK